jgi:NADH/NAD ratio-sensing transcriptional regulator Rex
MRQQLRGRRLARLALYFHAALETEREAITSDEIAEAAGANSSQVRRDLGTVAGHTGRRGLGSSSEELTAALRRELEPYVDALKSEADIARSHADALAAIVIRLGSTDPERP